MLGTPVGGAPVGAFGWAGINVPPVVEETAPDRKVRYRGIAKNGAQVFSLLALANLYLARRTFASA